MINLNTEPKNLRAHLSGLISNFELDMFAPQENTDLDYCIDLRTKFKTVFEQDMTFWTYLIKPKHLLANWCFFDVKSRHNHQKITISFCFLEDKIQIFVCDNIAFIPKIDDIEQSNEHVFERASILYDDIMADHQNLVNELFPIFDRAIRHANRLNSLKAYPHNETVINKEPVII